MAPVLRGGVYWVDLEPVGRVVGHEQGNPRPALVLSQDRFNDRTELAITALISSKGAGREGAILIKSVSMPQQSHVLLHHIRTLSVKRIGQMIGMLSDDEMKQVLHGLYLRIGL